MSPTKLSELDPGQRRAFIAAWFGYLLDGFDFILITLVLTEISQTFDLSLPVAATLVSAAFVSRWFGGLALGALGDRFGRKPAMITSILLFAAGSLLCGLSWDYWSLFAFRAIVGLGMAGEYGSSTTFVMESWPRALRNRATGFLLSAYPLGGILAARAYALIVPHTSWRWLFVLGAVPALFALYLRRSLPEAHEWEQNRPTEKSSAAVLLGGQRTPLTLLVSALIGVSLVLLFSGHAGPFYPLLILVVIAGFVTFAVQLSGRLWPMAVGLMAVVFCAFLASWPIQSLLPTYLKTELHYDAGQVANALTWAGLGYAVGSIVAGSLGDRFGTRTTYSIGLLIAAVLVFPAFALDGAHIVFVWILLFALQATGQGASGLLPKFIGDHYPVRIRAAGLGFTYNVGALGGAVAPLAGARVADSLGLGHAMALLACVLAVVTAVLVAFDVPRRLARPAPEDSPVLEKEAV
ncbi:sialate:H+ symport family MFS transporter [Cryptosporangium phraense]|uniref:MFS transporter n=1 Tax=Cryptosporangium phraense TaxID=2593070 RepID=A0A545AH38_9ACTN|nr:sialate:H+ symport family MFS transporter [Cryptosporangium phraense]TQS40633.1 MFS transporter [Cryptosporangium phraense]